MNKELRVRTVLVGLIGLLLITSSSMYIAMRIGALPWPTLLVTVLSLIFLKKAKDSSIQEITVAHTMMSSGSMIAGALAFTIPGIWITNPNANFPIKSLIGLTISGAIGGIIYTILLKDKLLIKDKIEFPIGEAAYETLVNGFNKKTNKIAFISSFIFANIFAYIRDGIRKIPAVITIAPSTLKTPTLNLWLSPMALAIGALIGPIYSFTWLLASVLSNFIAIPILISSNVFPSLAYATRYMQNLGIGLMVGTGLFVVLKGFINIIKNIIKKEKNKLNISKNVIKYSLLGFLLIIIILIFTTELKIYQIILMLILMGITTYISGVLTGQTGINPMEIMGILTLLAISTIYIPTSFQAFTICAIVSVACGLVGDVTNDLKSGYLSKTNDKALIISETIGAIIGSIISIGVFLLLKKAYGGFNNEFLLTPQAHAVSAMINGLEFPTAFLIGVILAIVLSLFKLPTATLGLGVYLPIAMSFIIAIGALFNVILKKFNKDKSSKLIASGLLGGEGLAGVIIAILMIIG